MYRILITVLLTSLGFSCVINDGGAAYGSPRATFKAKGIVVSELDDTPIKGIQAELKRKGSYGEYSIDTTFTCNAGSFFLEGDSSPHKILHVVLTDVDGEENGSFARLEIEADYTDITFTGSSSWYEGKAEIDLGIIRMKPE
jgi:putative lipoprotein (rSAM/lipoprotein system)